MRRDVHSGSSNTKFLLAYSPVLALGLKEWTHLVSWLDVIKSDLNQALSVISVSIHFLSVLIDCQTLSPSSKAFFNEPKQHYKRAPFVCVMT